MGIPVPVVPFILPVEFRSSFLSHYYQLGVLLPPALVGQLGCVGSPNPKGTASDILPAPPGTTSFNIHSYITITNTHTPYIAYSPFYPFILHPYVLAYLFSSQKHASQTHTFSHTSLVYLILHLHLQSHPF